MIRDQRHLLYGLSTDSYSPRGLWLLGLLYFGSLFAAVFLSLAVWKITHFVDPDGSSYLASKPYAAGGAYINKMSDYCKSCAYKVKEKVGEDACPFNYLYWDFISRNREKISANQRMSMIFRTYDKMTDVRKAEIARDSQVFLDRMA